MHDKIKKTVAHVVTLLVKGQYNEIVKLTKGVRLQAVHIESAVTDYRRTLIMPPDSAFDDLDIIEIKGRMPKQWSVRFDLWTKEEGRSDLSIELTLGDCKHALLEVELDNIHTL